MDAGNYVDRAAGGNGCSNKCQFMVTSYKDLHYDVLNIGKQEVWMGFETLNAMLDTTKNTQFVSANLIDRATRKPLTHPTVIKDYGNLRVGLIGLLNETDFPKGSTLIDSTHLEVQPALEAAKKYLPALIRKTDAVVVLCELGSGAIDTLVKQFPEIDVVISTGALRQGESPMVIGKTHVVGTGTSGYNGHYVTLEFNPAWTDSLGFAQFQDPLTDVYEETGQWADKLAAFNAQPPQPSAPAKPATSTSTSATPQATPPSTSTTKG